MKKREIRKISFPAWLYILAITVMNEVLLHLWSMDRFIPGRFVAVLAFAVGLGSVFALAVSLIPHAGAQKWTAVALGLIWSVFCGMEYFIDDTYGSYMTLATVLNGAGGIATGFLDVVISLLTREFWRIAVVLLPTVLFAVFCKSGRNGWRCRGALAGAAAAAYVLAFLTVRGVGADAATLNTTYQFDGAVRAFGLQMGLALEAVNGNRQEELILVTEPPEPTTEATESTEQPEEETVPPETTEPPVVYGVNTLPIDFDDMAERYAGTAVGNMSEYVASLTPSSQNAFTGLFEGKNLIFITAEAFTAEVIDEERTPTLYRMANEGIRFEDYYQPVWYAGTTTGEFSNLIGLVPTGGGVSMFEPVQQKLFLTMGNQLQALGYSSAAYHNNDYTFYERHLTHTSLGYDKFIGWGNGMEAGVEGVWPESDLEMIDFTIPEHLEQTPFNLYYMSVSGHSAYTCDGNAMARKNYHLVEDLPCSEPVKCYLAANQELESAMASLIRQLEEAGIADETVVVIAADHYPYGMDRGAAWGNNREYLSELFNTQEDINSCFVRDHNALIIWSGCLEGQNIVVEEPVYSLDILPTLSNLFGVAYDSRLLVGRDVFSDQEAVILWPNYSWKTELGTYENGVGFTPAPGAQVPEGYVERINTVVTNKIRYSDMVQKADYFNYLWKELQEE